ncbi:MAG: hypothetical protein WBZ36_01115 [Candidatus Nitrosopolaris sp.]
MQHINSIFRYKYSQYHINPDWIVQWADHGASNGSNRFLDEKVEQLRSSDSYIARKKGY